MCGIAGLIHRDKPSNIGAELTAMLQSLKHRGPDSTGFALYGEPAPDKHVMRFKVAEQEDVRKGFQIHDEMKERKATVDARMAEMQASVVSEEQVTEYAHRYVFHYDGDLRRLADYIEDVEGAEILSVGPRPRADQGPRRRGSRLGPVRPRRLRGDPCDRPHPDGDGVRRRYPFRHPYWRTRSTTSRWCTTGS